MIGFAGLFNNETDEMWVKVRDQMNEVLAACEVKP
jgi:hypothetical protein